jgi:hypothetical protein
MYGNDIIDSYAVRLEMERLDRQAAQAWRFRSVETKEVRALKAVVARARGFLSEHLGRIGAVTRPAHESLSY